MRWRRASGLSVAVINGACGFITPYLFPAPLWPLSLPSPADGKVVSTAPNPYNRATADPLTPATREPIILTMEFFGKTLSGPFTIPSGIVTTATPIIQYIFDHMPAGGRGHHQEYRPGAARGQSRTGVQPVRAGLLRQCGGPDQSGRAGIAGDVGGLEDSRGPLSADLDFRRQSRGVRGSGAKFWRRYPTASS